MTRTFLPVETTLAPEAMRGVPFERDYNGTFVSRGVDGVLHHSPLCTEFVKYGWCAHLNDARALAEHPRAAWASWVHSLATFGVEEGRSLRNILSDIATFTFEQDARERFLAEWDRQHETDPHERALDALARHSDPTIKGH